MVISGMPASFVAWLSPDPCEAKRWSLSGDHLRGEEPWAVTRIAASVDAVEELATREHVLVRLRGHRDEVWRLAVLEHERLDGPTRVEQVPGRRARELGDDEHLDHAGEHVRSAVRDERRVDELPRRDLERRRHHEEV